MRGINLNLRDASDSLHSDCIYKTDEYEVKRWEFSDRMSQINGWNDCFCIVLVANGEYSFNISKNEYNTYTGHVIVEKPNFDYSLLPTSGRCTILNFSKIFYDELCNEPGVKKNSFFSNPNIISQLLISNSVIDYLHYKIMYGNSHLCRLEMDDTVFELVYEIVNSFTDINSSATQKKQYQNFQLPVIERAKEYIHHNFKEDIGLQQIAENCFASPFHFSRVFRKFTLQSPYQYLLNTRLKHSEILLKTNAMPIAEVAVSSGFSSPDYFATVFKKKYKLMPTEYRKKEAAKK
jgi:AraC family transcriptional regulator